MSEVDALFRLLTSAPPRAAEIVKRVALAGVPLSEVASLYGVDEPRAKVLVFRALLDVESGGTARVPDEREAVEIDTLFGAGSGVEGTRARALLEKLQANKAELDTRLQAAAVAWEQSPARRRDDLLRYVAIAVVLALTAFFYWREQHKPRPPPQKRPIIAPAAPPP